MNRHQVDTWPWRFRVRDIMTSDPVFVDSGCLLADTASTMIERRISSVLVDRDGEAGGPGIITERDVVRAVANHGPAALQLASGDLMSAPLVSVQADEAAYVALGRMTRLSLRHLAVTDSPGAVCGIMTSKLLLRHQAGEALVINDALEAATGARDLADVHARLAPMAGALLDEGMNASRIASMISSFYRKLTARAARIAAADEAEDGWAFFILGSAGRGESLLAGDQDNAIVSTGEVDDAILLRIASRTCDLLDAAGLPYCKGGVMASNPEWRRSIDDWRKVVAAWATRADGASLLNVDIFFDLVHVHGDRMLTDRLRSLALEAARTPVLPRMMAEQLQTWVSPRGFLGVLKTKDGRLDLKIGGLFPLVAGARAMALRHGIEATGTAMRLAALVELGKIARADLQAFTEAHEVFLDLMVRQQIRDLEAGVPPGPGIDVAQLAPGQKRRLRRCLGDVSRLPGLVLDVTARG